MSLRPVQQQYHQIQEPALFTRTLYLKCQKYIYEVGFYSCQIYEPESTINKQKYTHKVWRRWLTDVNSQAYEVAEVAQIPGQESRTTAIQL